MNNETPISIESSVFSNRTNATLYVPAGSKAAYEAADYWKEFKEIVEMEETPAQESEDTDISQMDNVIYRSFQFDLYLPNGVSVVKSAKGKIQGALSPNRLPEEDEHQLTFSEQADGAIRFLCSSQYDETFTGSDGEIATLQIDTSKEMEDGDYAIILKNVILNETDISKFYETPLVKSTLTIKSFMLGDVNGDGVVDIADAVRIVNLIVGKIDALSREQVVGDTLHEPE